MTLPLSIAQTEVKKQVGAVMDTVVSIRRDLHQHPERSKREKRTSDLVAQRLQDLGLEVSRCEGIYGVVGLLRGANPGKTIALRADMDALKISEKTGLPFASQVEGVMHACGHDAHTAMLLGAAEVLTRFRDRLAGNVKFLFQPSEEAFPGGAPGMVAQGAMENPTVDAIFAWHVDGSQPAGSVSLHRGPTVGAVTAVSIKVKGVGGHFGHPDRAVDPIVVAAHVVVALQSVISRQVSPTEAAVLTFGTIQGGTRDSVIGDEVIIRGNIGAMNTKVWKEMPAKVERTVKGVTESMGAGYEIDFWEGYPAVHNDPKLTDFARRVMVSLVGEEKVLESEPTLGGEDFSYFLEKAPGVWMSLGVWNTEKYAQPRPMHHPEFDLDERAMPLGVEGLCSLVINYLEHGPIAP